MGKYKKIINISLQYKYYHLLLILIIAVQAILSISISVITVDLIDIITTKSSIISIIFYSVAFIIVSIITDILSAVNNYFSTKISNMMTINIKNELISKLFDKKGEFYCKNKIGEILSIINSDTLTITDLLTENIYTTISNVIIGFFMIIYLCILKWDLLLIILLLQPIMLLIQKYFSNKVYECSKRLRECYGEGISSTEEFISNAKQFITLGLKKFYLNKYNVILDKYNKESLNLEYISGISKVFIGLIPSISFAIIVGYGGYEVYMGSITIGALMVFMQYSNKLLQPVYELFELKISVSKAKPSIDRIIDLLNCEDNNKPVHKRKIEGKIEFKDVGFYYNENNYILKDLNLFFNRGKIYIITGRSGSGKSTICNLILGLWKVNKGKILIDDKDIEEYDKQELYDKITLISQESFILNDSIYNNIVLNYSNVNKDIVYEASKKAGIYNEILNMEDGFNTIVGDRGVNVSGGQKQRIAIARAIIRNTPIVIFDEPTSGLDSNVETLVVDNIRTIFRDKTVIIVSHNQNVIKSGDVIYNLNT